MNAKHVELLQRLEKFQLDSPEASLPFSARLARENNWSPAYAQRVIAEYKRFAFLAVAAGHPVSPSEDVDQAWHLHLTYSINYWKVFCPEILGTPLHHQPTRGGEVERDKFDDWYARTLASYEIFFGAAPPVDIWPAPDVRRVEKHDFIRVDRERNWVIPRPRFQLKTRYLLWSGLAVLTIACSGAMLAQGWNVFDWRGPDFLKFYLLLVIVCFGVAIGLRRFLRVPGTAEPLAGPELDGYATAYLNGGKVLVANTLIANLIRRNAMRVDPKNRRLFSLTPKPILETEAEEAIYAAAESTEGSSIADVRSIAQPAIARIADELKARGLVVPDSAAGKAVAIPLMIAMAAVVVGVIKIFVGISRDRPVGFLVFLCLVSGVIALFGFARRPLRSRKGDAVFARLRESHMGARRLGRNVAALPTAEFAAVVGLFGMTALAGTELDDLRRSLQPPANGISGCGSSCGGGGGGCGGGGCGGGGGGGCGGCGGGGH
jgi:uncharacterized protein (TIGR04222 family)